RAHDTLEPAAARRRSDLALHWLFEQLGRPLHPRAVRARFRARARSVAATRMEITPRLAGGGGHRWARVGGSRRLGDARVAGRVRVARALVCVLARAAR